MLIAVLLATVISLPPSQPLEQVPIFVGPPIREGFVDVDAGTLDSIRDLQAEFRRARKFRLASRREEAVIVLEVVARRVSGSAGEVGVPLGGGMAMMLPIDRHVLDLVLRVGTYERRIASEDGEHGTWKAAAKQAVKDVTAWLDANRHQLPPF